MANFVEFIIKMQDLTSGPLGKIGLTGVNAYKKIADNVDKVTGRNRVLGESINGLNSKLAELTRTRNLSIDSSQIKSINGEIDKLQAKKDKLTGSGSSGGGLGSFFRTGLSIAGIASMAYLGKDIMQAGMERQMNLTALQTLVGKNDGNLLNNQLLDYAKRSIYGGEVFNEGKIMAASGVKANNIMPIIHMLGDIGMGNKERMQSLALAFSEASTRGALTGINERMFLQGGLFNPLQQLHLMTGRSMADLKNDMEKGKIGVNELVEAMQFATGPTGKYFHMMENMQNNGAGKWTAFIGTVRTLAGTIGQALLPALSGITNFLQLIINNTPVFAALATGIGVIVAAYQVFNIVTSIAKLMQAGFNLTIMIPVAIIAILAGAITYLCLKYKNWGDSLLQLWSIAKNVGLGLFDIFKFATLDIIGLFDLMVLKIKASFEFLQGMMSNVGKAIRLAAHGDFKLAGQALAAPIQTEAGTRANALGVTLAAQREAHSKTLKNLFGGAQFKGLDFSFSHPRAGASPLSGVVGMLTGGAYKPDLNGGGGAPGSMKDTSAAISGGGVRNITINVQKFQDKTEIHAATFKEGIADVERTLQDMFERIVNSAATALS